LAWCLHPQDTTDDKGVNENKELAEGHHPSGRWPFLFAVYVLELSGENLEDTLSESEREFVKIFDTTLRDGEQSPGCSMTPEEKLQLAHGLEGLGVDVIEAGFPVASGGDFNAVQALAREIRRPVIAALARCCRADIEQAARALEAASHPRIHVFLATSDIHLQQKLQISRQQCLEEAWSAVCLAKSFCEDVEFSPEDATRSDVDFLCEVLATVIEAGATTVNIPDTVGYTVPSEYGELIQRIRRRVRGIEKATISAHCHNDLGLAVANSLAAVGAGARQIECTINGIGERAGNAALEEIVMAMRVRPDHYPYKTSVISENLFPISQLLTDIIGIAPQPNKAIIGVPGSTLILGKHSGRNALGLRCEALGFHLGKRELDGIYRQFIAIADKTKIVRDHQIVELIGKVRGALLDASGEEFSVQAWPGSGATSQSASRKDVSVQAASLKTKVDENEPQEDYLWGV
jgi:2-isopropylmalate synthase